MTAGPAGRVAPIFLANVLFGAGLFAHAFLYNFYLEAAGHGPGVMGNAAAALTAGGLTALVPAGILVDRLGPRAGYGAAAFIAGAGLSAGAFATSPTPIYLAAALAGAGTATWRVSMAPLLLRVTEGPLRARALSWNVGLLVASGAIWTALSGGGPAWLEQVLGLDRAGAIRMALLLGAGATVLAAPVISLLSRASGGAPPPPSRASTDRAPRRTPGSPGILVAVVLVAVWMTGSALVLPFFNIFFTGEHGLTVARTGVVLAIGQVVTAVALAGGAEAAARAGPGRALVIWMCVFPPAIWALGAAGALPLVVAFFLVQGVVPAATNPLIDQVLLERVPEERHGAVSSARNGATEVSGLVGAWLGGRLLGRGSFDTLFGVAGGVAAAGAIGLALWLARAQSRAGPSETRPRSTRQARSA